MSVDKRVDIEARGEAPLAVDLDGTLIRSDLFVEGMVRLAFGKPWLLLSLLFWLTRGRSYAKQRVFQVIDFDPAVSHWQLGNDTSGILPGTQASRSRLVIFYL